MALKIKNKKEKNIFLKILNSWLLYGLN